jgi:hypothetical protein
VGHDAPTDCRHTVSGTLSLPSRGTFHPSLTVLVHYRSPGSIQPYQAVLADSHGIPRAPRYSGTTQGACSPTPTGLSPTPAGHSHAVRLDHRFITPRPRGSMAKRAPQPRKRNPCRVSHATGLGSIRFRSPLLTESLLFSLPPGTEMFHFPGFPPPRLYIQRGVTPHHGRRVPPFGHPRITARLTAPRGLTRPPTSFIGSWYQGIHRAP